MNLGRGLWGTLLSWAAFAGPFNSMGSNHASWHSYFLLRTTHCNIIHCNRKFLDRELDFEKKNIMNLTL